LDIRNETGVDGIGIQTGTVSGIYLEINGNETENGNYLTGVRRNGSINYIPAHLYCKLQDNEEQQLEHLRIAGRSHALSTPLFRGKEKDRRRVSEERKKMKIEGRGRGMGGNGRRGEWRVGKEKKGMRKRKA